MPFWIDTHCHLDANAFAGDAPAVCLRAAVQGVAHVVVPAVSPANFDAVRSLAHTQATSYALGIHPLWAAKTQAADLATLAAALQAHQDDPRLVAVGEIGLDFGPQASTQAERDQQEHVYREQLQLARRYGLPVILHVRRSADRLLKHLRDLAPNGGWRGIAHAFNGSEQQALAMLAQGLKLGFGGAVTFDTARQLRRLAATLPLEALVLETDAPDMPPQWLYATAAQRQGGHSHGRNEPAELPRIAQQVADLRGIPLLELQLATSRNALEALPRLQSLLGMHI